MGGSQGSPRADRFADDPAFAVHEGGKLAVRPTRTIDSIADLALTYTPGVARVSSAIAAEPELARLFSEFGGLSAVPVVLSTTDVDGIVAAVEAIAPSFGGINLEDISAPRCFEIEDRLR